MKWLLVIVLSMLALTPAYSNSEEIMKKMDEVTKKIEKNADDFCTKGVKPACDTKQFMKDPTSVDFKPVPANKPSPAEAAEMQKVAKELQACGKDQACMVKLAEKIGAKAGDEFSIKCDKGDQEACFWKEHTKLSIESSKLLSELK